MNKDALLQNLRNEVQLIDKGIIKLLGKRFKCTKQIQTLKNRLKIPIAQKQREKMLLGRYVNKALKEKMSAVLIKRLFTLIFSYSKKSGIME